MRAGDGDGPQETVTARSPDAGRIRRGAGADDREPCLRCGVAIPARLMGCKGGHCPNCGYPYPHGDCSD